MESFLSRIEAASKIVAFIAAAIGASGALLQYYLNSEAEERMRALAVLETDIKVSALFTELVQTANGYGKWNPPNDEVIRATLAHLPKDLFEEMIRKDPAALYYIFRGSVIPDPVPLSAQVAAAESIANLALKYPFLKEPAIESLKIVMTFRQDARGPLDRLCRSAAELSGCKSLEQDSPRLR